MNKEILEKYIQFAIDNGYETIINGTLIKFDRLELYETGKIILYKGNLSLEIQLTALITSKEFIEAITRGLIRQRFSKNALEENIQNAFKSSVFQGKVKEITHNQADAIRDNKLEEFILSILSIIK